MSYFRPQVRATMLEGVDALLKQRDGSNTSLAGLLAEIGVPLPPDGKPLQSLSLTSYARVLERAAERIDDEVFGLHFATHYPEGSSGALGFLILSAPNLRVVVAQLARYARLHMEGVELHFEEQKDLAHVSWHCVPALTTPHKQMTEFLMALFVVRARRLLGDTWRPKRVSFTYPEPNAAGEYEAIFGRELAFSSPINQLTTGGETLSRPSPQANIRLYGVLDGVLAAELAARPPSHSIVDRVSTHLAAKIGSEEATLERTASTLHLTKRQLQLALKQCETNFETEMSSTRNRLAVRYLRDTDLPMTEIAFLLGFSELSAFTRAARGWFQTTPTEARLKLRAPQASH